MDTLIDPNMQVISICYDCQAVGNDPDPVELCPLHAAARDLAQAAQEAEQWISEFSQTVRLVVGPLTGNAAEALLAKLRAAIARIGPNTELF